jgi:hypothetical protein
MRKMNDATLAKLVSQCEVMGLSVAALAHVKEAAANLELFEKYRHRLKTAQQRVKQLQAMKSNALALCDCLKNLDVQSHAQIRWVLSEDSSVGAGILFTEHRTGEWREATLAVLASLVGGIDASIDGIGAAGKTGGRNASLIWYARHIGNMALKISKTDRITPGRGGDFERLCEALFEASGVHAKPEGALKYFMKHMNHSFSWLTLRPGVSPTMPEQTEPKHAD